MTHHQMKRPFEKFFKIVMWTIVVLATAFVVFVIGVMIWMRWDYYDELKQIKKDINKIEGVTVVDVWGHDDVKLEEIAARIQIAGKGEIVLENLNKDDNGYPNRVYITEFGGYSFSNISCNCSSAQLGVGPSLNIGTESYFGQLLDLRFDNAKMVIDNYDKIFHVIDSIAHVTNPLHISPEGKEINMLTSEIFLFFQKKPSEDQDPIFNLLGAEAQFESARKLPWKCESRGKSRILPQ